LTADFTVTIGSDQTAGRYLLADGAASFDGDVTVCGEVYGYYSVRPGFVDGELGTLAVGETLEVANQVYSLSVEGDTLVFTVAWASLCVLSVETDCTYLTEEPVTVTAVFSEDIVRPEYSYDGETWVEYVDGVAMADNGFVWFRGFDSGGKQSEVVRHEVYNIIHSYSIDGGDENGLNLPESASNQLLVLTYDDYNHSLQVEVDTDRVNLHALPNGRYSWKVRDVDDVEWSVGNEITVDNQEQTRLLSAVNDGNVDAFFGNARGVWSAYYRARHVGVGEWNGTGEFVQLSDKNRIEDIFAGSDDASILLLTDDENGDALFVDDIFSAFPDGLDAQSRIAKIDEIRAGAGNDIIDLTSQRFEYVGNGLTVKGGLGDDVIWANKGDNLLFGDAGDDRLVGAAGNDVIVGGKGDDSLHGGGGDDIFAFGLGWGSDTIEQREGGSTLLWFGYNVRAEISLSADGAGNAVLSSDSGSVTLLGIKHDDLSEVFASCSNDLLDGLSLRFGDDGSDLYSDLLVEGAFDGFTSKKVFEDTSKGILT
jgi:Ca2+-binding RTX toxin-like protein